MQTELDASHPGEVQLLAVNGQAFASGMATMAALGNLPILQDTAAVDAWGLWAVTYRDVVILDADNQFAGVYNLTTNDLNEPANYDALRDLLVAEIAP
jgi:hypothetical protein